MLSGDNMRVGYFVTHFPYENQFNDERYIANYVCSGGEIAAYELASSMARRGHEITIFTTSIEQKDSMEEHNNLSIYRYGAKFKIGDIHISFGLFRKPLEHDVDIVHAHHTTAPGVIAALIYARKMKKPLILTHHGFERFDHYGDPIRRLSVSINAAFLVNRFLSAASIIISPSAEFVEESRFLWRHKDKVRVIPNGINLADFDVTDSKEECRQKLGLPLTGNLILFLGSLVPRKGPDILVKALPEIIKGVPEVVLICGGKGVLRTKLEDRAKELGVERFVRFAGFITNDLKPLYLRAADIFVLPSTLSVEVFPIGLLEASAAGIPMVVSDLKAFSCIIKEGYNGIVTKRGDEHELANAIVHLLKNQELRDKMSKNAKKEAEDFSWERIAAETEALYYGVRA